METEDGVPPHRFVHMAYHQRHHTSWTFQCRRDPQEPLHRDPQVSLQPTGLTTAIRPSTASTHEEIVGTPSCVGAVTRGTILTEHFAQSNLAERKVSRPLTDHGRTLVVNTISQGWNAPRHCEEGRGGVTRCHDTFFLSKDAAHLGDDHKHQGETEQ